MRQSTLAGEDEGHALRIEVLGIPAPKGNLRGFVVKGKAILTYSNPPVRDWQHRVATEAQKRVGLESEPYEYAVGVTIFFYLPRPKSLPKIARHCIRKPDIDKLVRAVLDGLTGICYEDDKQVVSLTVSKQYAVGRAPGCIIEVRELGR